MKQGKIYYNSNTNKIIGTFRPDFIKYNDIPSDSFIEIEEKDWIEFLNQNQGKEFFIESEALIAQEFEEI